MTTRAPSRTKARAISLPMVTTATLLSRRVSDFLIQQQHLGYSDNQQAAAVQIGQVTRRDSRAIRRFIAMPATKAGMREQWHGVPDQFVKTLAPAGVKRIYEIVKVGGTMIQNETNVNKCRAPHHTL